MSVAAPTLVSEAFGINAVSPYINAIPLTTGTPGLASFSLGFPPLTMTPLTSGGIAPSGADMNGILNAISSNTAALCAGQWYQYNAGYSTAIGGYALGAILQQAADTTAFWISTVAANVTDPDTGGAGWLSTKALYKTLVAAAGATNNLALPSASDLVYDINTAAGVANFTGAIAQRDGQRVTFCNVGVNNLTFNALNSGSSGANQFRLPSDLALVQYQSLTLQYSAGAGVWVLV
jgi:hypothetical protein